MEQRFVLELDGRLAGRMFSVEGGAVKRNVPADETGFGGERATFDVEPMVCTFGTGMSRTFYDWIGRAVVNRTYQRKSGSVIQLDHHSKLVRRLEFFDALVTDIVFPELDTSSTKEAVMKFVMQPERVMNSTKGVKDLGVYASSLPKAWFVNQFRMEINGLHIDSGQIKKIKGLSVKQGTKQYYTEEERFARLEPTKITFSDITIEVPLAYGKELMNWFEDTVNPRKLNASEKSGAIEFLAPGSRNAYFVVDLTGLGIVSLAKTAQANVARLTYGSLQMSAGGGAVK